MVEDMLYLHNMREIGMSQLVVAPHQAIENILGFHKDLAGSMELQDRLPYARAWYAYQDDLGAWHFGPSKFIGYKGMTAQEYLDEDPRDGRRTERQLRQWFSPLEPDSDVYHEVNDALIEFLNRYGKTPSAKMRISITNEHREKLLTEGAETIPSTVVDMMLAVARMLPPEQRERLRRNL